MTHGRGVYYNENDTKAAAWLRELMSAGLIPAGDVDERSIADVRPCDLAGYRQCHFFAGIGGWPLALRLAGWSDEREVWTGSCPCQPFSDAGKQRAERDARHLFPVWRALIAERLPAIVFGEQVASALGRAWLSDVRLQMESMGYDVGAADLCAAGVGAPHRRQRLFFGGALGDVLRAGPQGRGSDRLRSPEAYALGGEPCGPGDSRFMADVDGGHSGAEREQRGGEHGLIAPHGVTLLDAHAQGEAPFVDWRDADWLFCRDGRWRPVEPGSFPLAHGLPARVVRLRGYGNAIVPEAGAEFIAAFDEARAAV